ncbi:distal tail protein Dit [Faecalimonas umbilicata]|uniref:distal tail protein Dit n=1 Tax=Faecalimonas umbilicata TaxID=1912855 RepID=UPI0022E7F3DA|nr:distal tail protein Dit [Faecalimonas umbilicata]
MGLLTVTYKGEKLPIKIVKVNRNLSAPISSNLKKIGIRNGKDFDYVTQEEKQIAIEYVINNGTAENLKDFRRKMAKLLTSDKMGKLIFSDEPNLYYNAILNGEPTLDEEYLQSSGIITFIVPDGIAHSTIQKTFQASLNHERVMEMTISNGGAGSVPVDYEIKHNHENGFLGIVSEYGVIQLGHVNEMDMEEKEKSEYLLNYRQASQYEAMRSGSGIFFDPSYGKSGTFGTYNYDNKTWVSLASAGAGSGWHGAARTIDLPPDQTGISGSANFAMQGKVWFRPTATNQCGIIEYCIADKNGRHLASARIAKWNPVTDTALLILCVNGKEMKRVEFNSALSELFVHNRGDFYISKSGRKITFCFGGLYSFNIADIEKMEAKTVSVFIGQRDNYSIIPKMYLNYLVFRKDKVKTWHDIPNRYPSGSIVTIDGKSRKVYMDGIQRAADEVLGSKYFNVPPGETKIQFYYSDFCSPPPTITAKIQEAYL